MIDGEHAVAGARTGVSRANRFNKAAGRSTISLWLPLLAMVRLRMACASRGRLQTTQRDLVVEMMPPRSTQPTDVGD